MHFLSKIEKRFKSFGRLRHILSKANFHKEIAMSSLALDRKDIFQDKNEI